MVTACWSAAASARRSVFHVSSALFGLTVFWGRRAPPCCSCACVLFRCGVPPHSLFGLLNALWRLPLPAHTPAAYGGGSVWAWWVALGLGTKVASDGPSNSLQVPRNFFRFCTLMITFRCQYATCGLAGAIRCSLMRYGGVGCRRWFSAFQPLPPRADLPCDSWRGAWWLWSGVVWAVVVGYVGVLGGPGWRVVWANMPCAWGSVFYVMGSRPPRS